MTQTATATQLGSPSPQTDKMLSRKEGRVGYVIYNNPERHNAVSLDMWASAGNMLDDFRNDNEIKVVVVTGAGGKAFVSGADISRFAQERSSEDAVAHYNKVVETSYAAFHEFPKPVIAMIRGYCRGGGAGLAVACDMRFASDDSRFGVPAAKLSVGYRFSGIRRLVELVGPAYTAEIFYTGRQFSAQEALQMGLVNKILPAAELEKYVLDYAATLAANAPLTLKAVKQCLIELRKDPSERDLDLCQKLVEDCFASQDYVEGRTAFMEKRKPVFKGK